MRTLAHAARLIRDARQLGRYNGARILATEDEDVSAAVAAAFREVGMVVREEVSGCIFRRTEAVNLSKVRWQ